MTDRSSYIIIISLFIFLYFWVAGRKRVFYPRHDICCIPETNKTTIQKKKKGKKIPRVQAHARKSTGKTSTETQPRKKEKEKKKGTLGSLPPEIRSPQNFM